MADAASIGSPRLTRTRRSVPVSLGRYEAIDSRQALVIEIGTKLTKIGGAGENLPQAVIRTEVESSQGGSSQLFFSSQSEVERYHNVIKFFKTIFFRHLLITPKDRRFVIVESVLTPTAIRNLIAKVLFETFEAASVLFAPSHLLATFPFGTKTALVIDIGYNEGVILPVLEGVTVLNLWEASSVGARRLEQNALRLLLQYGRVLNTQNELRKINEADLSIFEENRMIEDIVVRTCFATTMERGLQAQAAGFDLEQWGFEPPCDIRLPHGEEMLIVPGCLREWTAEVIFEYNTDEKSLPQMILDCIYKCPIDSRKKLLEGLLLTGGPTRMKGFYSRLKEELLRLLKSPDYSYAAKLGHIDSVQFYAYPNCPMEMLANWIGGSMFGSLETLQYRSTSRDDWLARRALPDWTEIIAQGA